jgi:DNA-binding transcriptional LysR family regulator
VSHLIKGLEQDLGCRLFDRVRGKTTLTEAGEKLMAHAIPILQMMDQARTELKHRNGLDGGQLRVGAPSMIVVHVLPEALRRCRDTSFGGRTQLVHSNEDHLFGLVDNGVLDIGIAVMPQRVPTFPFRRLFKDEMMLVSRRSHPVTAAGLARETALLPSRQTVSGQILRARFKEEGIRCGGEIEVSESAAAKEMVARGMGVAFMAPWEAEPELSRGLLCLRPIGKKMTLRTWIMFHRRGRDLTAVEEKLCEEIIASVSLLRKDRHDLPRFKRDAVV